VRPITQAVSDVLPHCHEEGCTVGRAALANTLAGWGAAHGRLPVILAWPALMTLFETDYANADHQGATGRTNLSRDRRVEEGTGFFYAPTRPASLACASRVIRDEFGRRSMLKYRRDETNNLMGVTMVVDGRRGDEVRRRVSERRTGSFWLICALRAIGVVDAKPPCASSQTRSARPFRSVRR